MKRSTKILSLVLSVLMLASVLSVFGVFADEAELEAIKAEVNLTNMGLASYHEGRHAIRVKFSVSPETPANTSVIEFGGIVTSLAVLGFIVYMICVKVYRYRKGNMPPKERKHLFVKRTFKEYQKLHKAKFELRTPAGGLRQPEGEFAQDEKE